jgi:hypothetical protein
MHCLFKKNNKARRFVQLIRSDGDSVGYVGGWKDATV